MTANARLYLKLFAHMAIPFAIVMLPFNWLATMITEDLSNGWAIGTSAASAVLYGAFMARVFGRRHVRAVEALVGAPTDEALSPRQTKILHVDLPPAEVFERCRKAIGAMPRARITSADAATGVIEAKVGAAMKSWGEIVNVRVEPAPSGTSSIEISSRPSFRPTIVDYGVNLQNVLAIERALAD